MTNLITTCSISLKKKKLFSFLYRGWLRSWWDSDRMETIIDPVQHSAIVLIPFPFFWKSLVSIFTYSIRYYLSTNMEICIFQPPPFLNIRMQALHSNSHFGNKMTIFKLVNLIDVHSLLWDSHWGECYDLISAFLQPNVWYLRIMLKNNLIVLSSTITL